MRNGASGSNPAAEFSLHQAGYAVDIDGTRSENFKTIREVMLKNGFTWGGAWKRKDPPHFEINPFGRKGTEAYKKALKDAIKAASDFYTNHPECR